MTTFATQAYNMMLQSLLLNITAALPSGTVGTRLPVGNPETIPDKTFITRRLKAGDGIELGERTSLNKYIDQATTYHNLFGLTPIQIDSIEDILNHLMRVKATIGRIRIVSHGGEAFLFVPLFKGGSWSVGIDAEVLEAFRLKDEDGLRFLISSGDKNRSPILVDSVSTIVAGIRAHNSAVLAPFDLAVGGSPPAGDQLRYFEVINDLYQVRHGIGIPPSPAEEDTLTASLNLIEKEIRGRLVGTVIGAVKLKDKHMTDLRDAILEATPAELDFFGSLIILGESVLTKLATAMRATQRSEDDLRDAILPNWNRNRPMFPDNTANIITGLNQFNPLALELAGEVRDSDFIYNDDNLRSFLFLCNDLFFLNNGRISINGTPIKSDQRTELLDGLRAIANIISAQVVSNSGVTAPELTRLREGVEALTTRQALTNSLKEINFSELKAANTALTVTGTNVGFRAKLNHLRSIMINTSNIDIRGCLVGAQPDYLDIFGKFLGTDLNRPSVSAPKWFQSFPPSNVAWGGFGTPIFDEIDNLADNGLVDANISAADVNTSFTTWRELIGFDPHFAFISGLFYGALNQFDFATLEWRVWRTGAMTTGIPILRMEAERIDDIVGLNLGDILDRFRMIFDIPGTSAPDAATRGRLTQLQPHIVTFKTIRTTVAAITSPTDPSLPGLQEQLTTLAGQVTGIAGFPAPGSPLPPASASLADIQASVTRIQTHVDSLLMTTLNTFFTAIQSGLAHANAQIRYYYNIGLPLLLQSSMQPTYFKVTTYMSATSDAQRTNFVANALRSWMKIQWTGTAAQATAMNTKIGVVAIKNDAQRFAAAQVSMLTKDDTPKSDADINPMSSFQTHIITRP